MPVIYGLSGNCGGKQTILCTDITIISRDK